MLNLIHSTNLYLYGHESLIDSDNKHILLSLIEYVKETDRFHV